MKLGFKKSLMTIALSSIAVSGGSAWADDDDDDEVEITFIHSGDFHGDYHPHVNGRADSPNPAILEGGMARAVTKINEIRKHEDNVIHVHTGDTIAGSATATFTKGDALVQMVDQLGIDVATPGNWEFSYGIYRYLQFFGVEDSTKTSGSSDIGEITDNSKMAIKIGQNEDGLVPSYGAPFREVTFADGSTAMNRWGMVAANVYINGTKALDNGVVNKGTGKLLTPPYRIIEKEGVKIGFIGCTTNRGPQVVSSNITTGISFTNCKGEVKFPQNRPIDWKDDVRFNGKVGGNVQENPADASTVAAYKGDDNGQPTFPSAEGGNYGHVTQNEIVKWTKHLRDVEGVDLVAVMSEAGIAENVYAAENLGQGDSKWNGPDIYFSSDMHEETNKAVIVTDPAGKKVIIVENSEDIAQIGELEIEVKKVNGRYKIKEWEYTAHDILDNIDEDLAMADLVDEVDQDMRDLIASGNAVNPYNGHVLTHQLDEVIGSTDMVVERNRFSNEHSVTDKVMPAVIEGTGHALITDSFRALTGSEVGGIRGFRYTNTVLPGDNITWGLLYHYMPIGPMIAKANIPTTATSEAAPDLSGIDSDGDGFADADLDKDGRVLQDNKENKRHFLAWPRSLQQEIELSGNSTMNPIIFKWGGGWVFNYSGVNFDFKPTGKNFNKYGKATSARVSNIALTGGDNNPTNDNDINNSLGATVSYASYYYDADANRINRNKIVGPNDRATVGEKIQILAKDASGDLVMVSPSEYKTGMESNPQTIFPLDAVEALARYISEDSIPVYNWSGGVKSAAPMHTAQGLNGLKASGEINPVGGVKFANFEYPRINLVNDAGKSENTLVDCTKEFGSPCIEPLRGAEGAIANGNVVLPANYIKGVADAPSEEGEF